MRNLKSVNKELYRYIYTCDGGRCDGVPIWWDMATGAHVNSTDCYLFRPFFM